MRITDYDYSLPDHRIARHPLHQRSAAKMLHYRGGEISDHHFYELPELLPPGTLLIGNETRVIHARLHFPLPGGKRPIEVFCLEPLEPADYALSLGSTHSVTWKCLVGGNRRWKSGEATLEVPLNGTPHRLTATRGERREGAFTVTFSWESNISFGEMLDAAGSIPLPPYLGRESEESDRRRYQTVFARRKGSVAAPTAGLHFTPEVMRALAQNEVNWRTLTLHVGAGTFKPVSSEEVSEHVMHREFFSVSRDLIERLLRQLEAGTPIVSVGTTSMRCLESLCFFGERILAGTPPGSEIGQWAARGGPVARERLREGLEALAAYLQREERDALTGYTQIMLSPESRPSLVDGLITNFHQPRSTLLLLVASLIGNDWRRVYEHALAREYRFLSYGDSSLLWRRGRLPQ